MYALELFVCLQCSCCFRRLSLFVWFGVFICFRWLLVYLMYLFVIFVIWFSSVWVSMQAVGYFARGLPVGCVFWVLMVYKFVWIGGLWRLL